MSSVSFYPSYDVIAPIRAREDWDSNLTEAVLQMLKKLILQHLPEGGRILDLCCGTGHLIQLLQRNGYKMTGLDGSEQALIHAREKTPDAEFILSDARFFKLPPTFHGVICYKVIPMILNLEDLTAVFRNVHAAMLENGLFAFNVDLVEDLSNLPREWVNVNVEDDYAWCLRYLYQQETRMYEVKVTVFQLLEGNWHRSDSSWFLKVYLKEEIYSALETAGFTDIGHYNLERELGINLTSDQDLLVCRKN